MRWIAAIGAMLMLAAALLIGPARAQEVVQQLPPPATDRVALDTSAGRIVLEIETERAPVTAANFLRYVDHHRLDGVKFYRVVKVDTRWGFVQFGVQNARDRVYPPIAHEPTTQTGLTHSDGTITVARAEPGTGQGEFVIVLGDQSGAFDAHRDAEGDGDKLGNAAFGRVVEGMDVLLSIFDAPVSDTATIQGVFQGQVPEEPVTILKAERVAE